MGVLYPICWLRNYPQDRGTLPGIGDQPFQAYNHKVAIRLQAATEAFTVPCAFMPDLRIDCILGQNGFFDTHKIVGAHPLIL
jgi:hypothetical protein